MGRPMPSRHVKTTRLFCPHCFTTSHGLKIMNVQTSTTIALLGTVSALALPLLPSFAALPSPSCPMNRSMYTAIGKPDYKITFDKQMAGSSPMSGPTATLQHPKRGQIGRFTLGQGNGYGEFYLENLKPIQDAKNSFTVAFFDAALRDLRNVDAIAPTYLHVAGLGSSDWYSGQAASRNFPLGDVMWKLSGCRK